jgi:hypothetical protein
MGTTSTGRFDSRARSHRKGVRSGADLLDYEYYRRFAYEHCSRSVDEMAVGGRLKPCR